VATAAHAALVTLNTNFSSKHKRLTILPKKMDEDKEKAMSEVNHHGSYLYFLLLYCTTNPLTHQPILSTTIATGHCQGTDVEVPGDHRPYHETEKDPGTPRLDCGNHPAVQAFPFYPRNQLCPTGSGRLD
jgi:hypothetical protein